MAAKIENSFNHQPYVADTALNHQTTSYFDGDSPCMDKDTHREKTAIQSLHAES